MIGQNKLKSELQRLIEQNSLPSFSLVIGERGSEKNEVAQYIAKQAGITCVDITNCKIDSIRVVIQGAYRQREAIIYNIQEADTMSQQAQNALLKVTEEPPNKARFIMTLEDENNTLATIISRATIFRMETLSPDTLRAYCDENYSYSQEERELAVQMCATTGELEMLSKYKPTAFYEYVEKVVDNIVLVSGANSFKIAGAVKLKEDSEGYDLRLFWKAFCLVCMNRGYFEWVRITSSYLKKAKVRTINKQMLFDGWILDIREADIYECD